MTNRKRPGHDLGKKPDKPGNDLEHPSKWMENIIDPLGPSTGHVRSVLHYEKQTAYIYIFIYIYIYTYIYIYIYVYIYVGIHMEPQRDP
jgi:hypothetical protein